MMRVQEKHGGPPRPPPFLPTWSRLRVVRRAPHPCRAAAAAHRRARRGGAGGGLSPRHILPAIDAEERRSNRSRPGSVLEGCEGGRASGPPGGPKDAADDHNDPPAGG